MSDQETETNTGIPRQFYTHGEVVEGEVSVWAIPLQHTDDKGNVFRYILSTTSPWQDGAVKVHTDIVKMQLPSGVNLYLKALETLEEQKTDAYTNYRESVRRIDDRISALKLLAAPKPDPMDIVGEVVEQQLKEDDDDGDEIPY